MLFISIAVSEAASPHGSKPPVPTPTSSGTPMAPTAAPISSTTLGFCPSRAHALSVRATGASAITEDATELGSNCAAMNSSRKKPPMLRMPSRAERQIQAPCGSRRVTARSRSAAGAARSADPHSG